ncbi:biotin transporter BioY [Eubacteriales bacterium KG127]
MTRSKLYYLNVTALFTALIAVGAFIKIPMPLLPFTLQTFFTMLACFLLPKQYSALSAGLYLALGLIGLPIFTSGGGIGYVMNPGFGYLVGFVVANYVAGTVKEKLEKDDILSLVKVGIVNLIVVYAIGLGYWYLLANVFTGGSLPFWKIFMNGFVVTIGSGVIKLILAVILAKRLIPAMKKA